MIVDSVTVGPFESHCYLVLDESAGAAVLVDPGDEIDRIAGMAGRHGAVPSAIWLTHAHLDHIGAVQAARRAWPGIAVHLHPADAEVYAWAARAAAAYGVQFEQPDPPDATLADGQVLRVGALSFTVWHLPGHAPGHVAFIGAGVALSGDCLFAGSVGRTDLPASDAAVFVGSLERLLELPESTNVLPGHGPPTTIGRERASNPFLTGMARVPGTARRVSTVSSGPLDA
jgi:glyoxylase-like metal-dependent hydrolase (beta-lactamase superfamily II)